MNIYGPKGCGKTSIMRETSLYMQKRAFYSCGIYMIDLDQRNAMQQATDICKRCTRLVRQESSSNLTTFPSRGMSQEKVEHVLLIFDNCDSFLKNNKTAFNINLLTWERLVKRLSMVFISENKLSFQDMKCGYVNIPMLTLKESTLLLITMNQKFIPLLEKLKS